MRLPLQLVSLLSLKLAVPAARITGTFQNNSVDGTSSALMGVWPGRVGGGEPVAATPLFQLAGSPSLKTVSLTFSIQVSRLKCRYEQFFLPQHSQTRGRGVGANPPALLFLPRQKRKGGGPAGPDLPWNKLLISRARSLE